MRNFVLTEHPLPLSNCFSCLHRARHYRNFKTIWELSIKWLGKRDFERICFQTRFERMSYIATATWCYSILIYTNIGLLTIIPRSVHVYIYIYTYADTYFSLHPWGPSRFVGHSFWREVGFCDVQYQRKTTSPFDSKSLPCPALHLD